MARLTAALNRTISQGTTVSGKIEGAQLRGFALDKDQFVVQAGLDGTIDLKIAR